MPAGKPWAGLKGYGTSLDYDQLVLECTLDVCVCTLVCPYVCACLCVCGLTHSPEGGVLVEAQSTEVAVGVRHSWIEG